MIHRAFRYRLYPTPEQEETLRQFAGVTRLVYNLALEQRRDFWRQYRATVGHKINWMGQCREITELRRQFDFIRAAPSMCLTQAMRDLDRAYAKFFTGRGKYPTMRRRGVNDSFRLQATDLAWRRINRRWATLRVPNLGWVKFRITKPLDGQWVSVTIRHDALGWHASFACEIEHEVPANDNPAVGIDRGISIALALSTGEALHLPDFTGLDRRYRAAQRVVSRRKRGSRRRLKAVQRAGRLRAKIARARSEWQHRVSSDLASRFGVVAIEDLKVSNMVASGRRKRGLNRSILEQGWGAFADKLSYKLEERGGTLIKVNPAFTSQECSACGAVDSRSRESQSSFACTACGFRANADHNAAIIILRRSTSAMPVEGRAHASVEAGTCLEAA